MEADPTRMKAVPSKAVKMRETKKVARFGASAVPMLQTKNRTAEVRLTCGVRADQSGSASSPRDSHRGNERKRGEPTNLRP